MIKIFAIFFVAITCIAAAILAPTFVLASAMSDCRGGNRDNRLWAFCWDHGRWMAPVAVVWIIAELAAFFTWLYVSRHGS
jgi:hypothetical protein